MLETPKASRNKYKYDAEHDVMRLGATLGEGLAFPYDFGFFPSTLGEDGDPLERPPVPRLRRAAGVRGHRPFDRRARGRAEGEAQAVEAQRPVLRRRHGLAHSHERLKHIDELRPRLLPEIEAFFTHYAGLNGKELRVVRRSGPLRRAQARDGRRQGLQGGQ